MTESRRESPEAAEYCAREVRRLDHDRFLCALFAPADRRPALLALLAFNLEVARIRESVTEPLLGEVRLRWWHEAVDAAYDGAPPGHPVAGELAAAVRRFDLTRDHFDALLAARAFDLGDQAPADMAALVDYAAATSGRLTGLALEVVDARHEAAAEAGHHVGIAWALTGLVRAVPFHAAARRIYLPTDLTDRHGADLAGLLELRSSPGLRDTAAAIAATARDHLTAARSMARVVGRRALPALLPATLADGYLRRLARAGHDPFDASVQGAHPGRVWKLAVMRGLGRF